MYRPKGRSRYARRFDRLNAQAAAKAATATIRMEQRTFSSVTGVGASILECRIDFGPGYRVYFDKHRDALIILLGGETKKRQHQDIETARDFWREYKRRERREI